MPEVLGGPREEEESLCQRVRLLTCSESLDMYCTKVGLGRRDELQETRLGNT